MTPYSNVHVIINPASGKDEPILNVMSDVFKSFELLWSVHVTQATGDATRMVEEAVKDKADLIIMYGGDGTLMEVINGIVGSDVPLGILPGGTGNSVCSELGVPPDLREALEMTLSSTKRRSLDVGQVGDHYFILRLFTGISEDQVADREMKDKYGLLAYPVTALKFLLEKEDADYHLILDGHAIDARGFICYVDNVGSVGGLRAIDFLEPMHVEIDEKTGPQTYKANVDPSDGLLDVILIGRNVEQLTALASFLLNIGDAQQRINYWQVKTVTIAADPPQPVWIDGEFFGETPCEIKVVPAAVSVIVPEPQS